MISSTSKIPKNVNYFLHFLKHEYITENDIEWVLKLRGSDKVSPPLKGNDGKGKEST